MYGELLFIRDNDEPALDQSLDHGGGDFLVIFKF
jgi:hypothetical protein